MMLRNSGKYRLQYYPGKQMKLQKKKNVIAKVPAGYNYIHYVICVKLGDGNMSVLDWSPCATHVFDG